MHESAASHRRHDPLPPSIASLPRDRASAVEARVVALEARISVVEARAATAETTAEILKDVMARIRNLEDEAAGRVDETVIGRVEAARLLGISVREFSRLARSEPELAKCWFRPGGRMTRMKFVRRKLLAYRDSNG